MCGRYTRSRPESELIDVFHVHDVVGEALPASYNIAPTQNARVILERAPHEDPDGEATRQLRTLRWGLIPSWAKDPKIGSRMVNARIETVTEKPAFKRAAAKRRLLVPSDGYFEWQKRSGAAKVPHFMYDANDAVLAFAGLYELWPDPAKDENDPDRWLWTFTILTTQATDALGHIHDRTPVLVPPDMRDDWLDPQLSDLDLVRQVLDALPEPTLSTREVSPAVNSPRNDSPDLITAVR